MPKVDTLFIFLESKTHDSLNICDVYLLQVNVREQFLDTSADLADLVVFCEVVQNDQRFPERKTEGLTPIF